MSATDTDGPPITVGDRALTIRDADVQLFWARVDRSSGEDGCWLWTGGRGTAGYGRLRLGGRLVLAHRLSYVLAYGGINPGLVIDHRCHTHGCVNPVHLRQVMHAENLANRAGAPANSRSGVRGVCWDAREGRWQARATRDGRSYHGGYHDDLEVAETAAIRLRLRLGIESTTDSQRLADLTVPKQVVR